MYVKSWIMITGKKAVYLQHGPACEKKIRHFTYIQEKMNPYPCYKWACQYD